ncbi:retrovirus-related pol polyprotein from transposon TNT 1-94 [Tanacetum coccineum]
MTRQRLHTDSERLQVWELIPRLEGKNVIVLKWLCKNKSDAENIVVRNKTRLVAKGYKQEEGIDFEESFAHVAHADHAGCKDDCKSTSVSDCNFLGGGKCELEFNGRRNKIVMCMFTAEDVYVSPSLALCTSITNLRIDFLKLFKDAFEYLVVSLVIIMAQQQHAADVHPDELCPPNKRYDLMDANKKVDLEHVQCPPESKIMTNIIKNHPLRFSIATSSSVPWIYMAQFWHTLKEDGSKYRLKFMLDKKELSLILDDFRTIFHLP